MVLVEDGIVHRDRNDEMQHMNEMNEINVHHYQEGCIIYSRL